MTWEPEGNRVLRQFFHFHNKPKNYEPEGQSSLLKMTRRVVVERGMWAFLLPPRALLSLLPLGEQWMRTHVRPLLNLWSDLYKSFVLSNSVSHSLLHVLASAAPIPAAPYTTLPECLPGIWNAESQNQAHYLRPESSTSILVFSQQIVPLLIIPLLRLEI